MFKKRTLTGAASAVLGITVVGGSPSWAEQHNHKAITEEVIVYGEKTRRSLQDTISSVSVIPAKALNTMLYQSITDAVSEVPNIVVVPGTVPDIRGVSGNGAAGGFNSISGGAKGRVSILLDGVAEPFVADMTGDTGIWDIEQMEVYRGPQSTSNGRNSIAGSIYIRTKDPSFDREGAVRAGYRSEDHYIDTAAMLSGPVIADKLAFRLTAERLDAETITDETGSQTNPPDYDLNEIRTNRVRGKLLWTPTRELSAMLTYSSNDERGDTGRIYYEGDGLSRRRLFYRNITTKSNTSSLNVEYELNANLSVEVLMAVMDYSWGFDSYEPTGAPTQTLLFDETNATLETKLNFGRENEKLNGFIGLFYFERDHDILSSNAYTYSGDDQSDSTGIYGEISYSLSTQFDLIAGGRIERESQQRNFTYGLINAVLDQDQSISLPKLALRYQPDETTTVSLSYRKGYNAAGGALNFTAREYYYFEEEKVDTFELGVRSNLNEGAIQLTANVFYNNYDGYQALSSTRFITNLDEVVSYGTEVEFSYRPMDNIELTGGLGLLKTDIKQAGDNYPGVNGNELNSAPTVTANLGLRYFWSETFNVGTTVNYVDEYFGDFSNTAERVAGDYTLVRLHANYEASVWTVAAYVNNLFDKDGYVTREPGSRRFPGGYVSIVDPRHAGVSVTYSF